MVDKKWYMSKTVWGAVLVLGGAVISALGYPDLSNALIGVGASLGIVGIRDANGKLKWQ